MTRAHACAAIEAELIATAIGDTPPAVAARVAAHVDGCGECREAYARYRTIEAAATALKRVPVPGGDVARGRLLARLSDLRRRLIRWSVCSTPLGPVLIGLSEHGVALVEYVGRQDGRDSWLLRQRNVEPEADAGPLGLYQTELTEYLARRRSRLDWPLDLRFVRSDFQREVLSATARVPYGAVSSYAGIAADIGRPKAVRAVAGALRHNPIPIVLPCHRIVGSGGALVGYSGTRVGLKERLLEVEGVRLAHRHRGAEIDRSAMYGWDRRDRMYCLPSCGEISEQPIGAVTLIATVREAEGLGLAPCPDCRPDLHPLGRRRSGRSGT